MDKRQNFKTTTLFPRVRDSCLPSTMKAFSGWHFASFAI